VASKKESGEVFFNEYYEGIYKDRWPCLKEALIQESNGIGICYNGFPSYFLDAGSIAAACALPVDSAVSILDLCAAPGGKTVILSHLINTHAEITANELSADRRTRLLKVLNEHIPHEIRQRITVTPFDGSRMYKKNISHFDAILLDAPCSSERHVLMSPSHLSQWTKARIRNLSYTQWSLLSAAYLMLKDNGYLLYSTCALAPEENDGVISKLCKKYDNVHITEIDCDTIRLRVKNISGQDVNIHPEKTTYGLHILPDTSDGSGPLFFCLIKKGISKFKN
jgi:16S rRNA C967 or C1407 C5-methylase (RsmB/RsmF family)